MLGQQVRHTRRIKREGDRKNMKRVLQEILLKEGKMVRDELMEGAESHGDMLL